MTKILDQNMAVKKADIDGIKFYSPDTEEFSLEGFAWRKAGMPFYRFAGYNTAGFRDALINLAKYPAGVNLRFISNSKRIVIRAAFRQVHKIARMALTGSMGFDVYVRDQGEMVFRGVTSFGFDAMDYCVDLFSDSKQKMRQFLINFPLYGDIESLEIGLENEAEIKKAHAWNDSRPLICYGTSILHGACANRPGMAYPAILSRTLDRPVMNFGFAGNARGDAYMAEMLASIKAPCCYILDYDPNSSWENTRTTAENFIGILRKKHPEVPIVFVSNIPYPGDFTSQESDNSGSAFVRNKLEREMIEAIDFPKLYFIDGTTLLNRDFHEASVDGCHISDYGFMQMAKNLSPELERIISGYM